MQMQQMWSFIVHSSQVLQLHAVIRSHPPTRSHCAHAASLGFTLRLQVASTIIVPSSIYYPSVPSFDISWNSRPLTCRPFCFALWLTRQITRLFTAYRYLYGCHMLCIFELRTQSCKISITIQSITCTSIDLGALYKPNACTVLVLRHNLYYWVSCS